MSVSGPSGARKRPTGTTEPRARGCRRPHPQPDVLPAVPCNNALDGLIESARVHHALRSVRRFEAVPTGVV